MKANFFQRIYENYNPIWQQVLKLTLINNNFVEKFVISFTILFNIEQSFQKILEKAGVAANDPLCQFLLQVYSQPNLAQFPAKPNQHYRYQNTLTEESTFQALIDYKQFLNCIIKTLSLEKFDIQDFVIHEFWKVKFLTTQSSSQQYLPIEVFNQAFYQFFNKETRLLGLEQIEPILNECFSYLLKKNKKYISRRNLKKVVKRHFKELFYDLLIFEEVLDTQMTENFGQPQNQFSLETQDQRFYDLDLLGSIPKEETLGGGKTTNVLTTATYYPDSLDTRQNRLTRRLTGNPSRSLHENSIHQNYNRSKSIEKSINQISTQENLLLYNRYDVSTYRNQSQSIRPQASKLLFYTLQKSIYASISRTVFGQIKSFSQNNNLKQNKDKNDLKFQKYITNNLKQNKDKGTYQQEFEFSYESRKGSGGLHSLQALNQSIPKRMAGQERQTFSFNSGDHQKALMFSGQKQGINYQADTDQEFLPNQIVGSFTGNKSNHQQISLLLSGEYDYEDNMIPQEMQPVQEFHYYNEAGNQKQTIQSNNTLCYSSNTPSNNIPHYSNQSQIHNNPNSGHSYQQYSQHQNVQNQPIFSTQNENTNGQQNQAYNTQQFTDIAGGSTKTTTHTMNFLQDKKGVPLYQKSETWKVNKQGQPITTNQPQQYIHLLSEHKRKDAFKLISGGGTDQENEESMLELEQRLEQMKTQAHSGRQSCPPARYNKLCLQGNINLSNQAEQMFSDKKQREMICKKEQVHSQPQRMGGNHVLATTTNASYRNQMLHQQSSIASDISDANIQKRSIEQHSNARQSHNKRKHTKKVSHGSHTLIHHNKSKDQSYLIEKKYKKMKEKLRLSMAESASERSKNQQLVQCNYVINEKVENLEQINSQLKEQLFDSVGQNEFLQDAIKRIQNQIAMKQILRLQGWRDKQELSKKFQNWKNNSDLLQIDVKHREQRAKFNNAKLMIKVFKSWVVYKQERQNRKAQRRIRKFEAKLLKLIFKRHNQNKKVKALQKWKAVIRIEKEKPVLKSSKTTQIDSLEQRRILSDKRNSSDKENRRFANNIKSTFEDMIVESKSSIDKFQNLTSPLYKKPLNDLPPRDVSNFQNQNSISQKKKKQPNNENMRQSSKNYSEKSINYRKQTQIDEGIEKMYGIQKKILQIQKLKYFSIWKIVGQRTFDNMTTLGGGLVQNNINNSKKMFLVSPIQNISADADFLQGEFPKCNLATPQMQVASQDFFSHQQMTNPCYYKTNEGYFYLNEKHGSGRKISHINDQYQQTQPQNNLNISNITSHNNSVSQLDLHQQNSFTYIPQVPPKPVSQHAQNNTNQGNNHYRSSSNKCLKQRNISFCSNNSNTTINNNNVSSSHLDLQTKHELNDAIAYLKAKINP